jgi:hypothetical protein
MSLYFIFNNLKVNSFILQDTTYPGFELLTWEKESWTQGTLWDIGEDAGFTIIGKSNVSGQLWICRDVQKEKEIYNLFGVDSGISQPIDIEVKIKTQEDLVEETIKAKTFALTKILESYRIVNDGFWTIKRVNEKNRIIC